MPEPAAIITAPGAAIPICRDEGRIGTDAPRQVIGHVCHVADPFNRALVSLAWRLDAAHTFGADRCRVRGMRREDRLVSRAESMSPSAV